MFWVKYHLNHLRNWRKAVGAVVKAVDSLKIDAEIYVIGGAAENKLTILSDIDLLLCLKSKVDDIGELRERILFRAMDDYGLPWDYPIELHIRTPNECREILKKSKAIKLK